MIRQLLRSAKSITATALDRSGMLDAILKKRLAGRVSVIMYHRVIPAQPPRRVDSNPGIIVTAEQFAAQMQALRERFRPLTLQEFQHHVATGEPPPERSCLVTFDDGWIDNYETALPILREYDIPSVLFLPCDYISSDRTFWQEEMLMRLTRMAEAQDTETQQALVGILSTRDGGYASNVDDIRLFVISLKRAARAEVDQMLSQIRAASAHCVEADHHNRHISWEQARAMRDAGVTFASHALSHNLLPRLSPDRQQRELTESKETLERELGEPVYAIAYPNGDYDEAVLKATRTAGYTLGFSTREGLFEVGSDAFTIPRFNVHGHNGHTAARFKCAIGNLF